MASGLPNVGLIIFPSADPGQGLSHTPLPIQGATNVEENLMIFTKAKRERRR